MLKQFYSEKAVTSTLGICLEILNLYEHDALLVHAKSLISVVDFIGKIYKIDVWSRKKLLRKHILKVNNSDAICIKLGIFIMRYLLENREYLPLQLKWTQKT